MAMRTRTVTLLSSLLSALTIASGSSGAIRDDTASLLAFKAELTDHGSDVLPSWNGSTSLCGWEGVACGGHGRVVALSLPSHGLTGTLSRALGNLTSLRTLNLSFNWFRGEVPASVGRLVRLRTLDLSYNTFSGMLPANLSSCINLLSLRLHCNRLHGRVLVELGHRLTSLRLLSLANNSLTGAIPGSLANLSSLQYLDLARNQLKGHIPPEIGNIEGLLVLEVVANNLSGVITHSVYNLSLLKELRVAGNMLSGTIPSDIGDRFRSIEFLGFTDNTFSGAIPSSLSNLSTLEYLDLTDNSFTGSVPPALGRLQGLIDLYLSGNKLEANDKEGWEFIASLKNSSKLQHLVLSKNSFNGKLPSSIANLSSTLQILYLGDNRISGVIPSNIGNLVGLKILEMTNTSISGVIPESIGRLQNLVELGLYNTSLSGLIPSSLGNLTQLTRFYAYYGNLEGPIPASLGKLKNLFILDLSTNRLNGSIPGEVLKLPELSIYLDLSYNSLSGPLPSEVGSLTKVDQLILSGNQLSGRIPDSIGNCISLEQLLLDHNSFEGIITQSLKNLKGLTLLNLTLNKLSGSIPDFLGSIGGLQQLYLANNNLSGLIPTVLQNLTSLSKLDLSFNNLQGEVPKGGVFSNGTYLSIDGNVELCGGTPLLHLAPSTTTSEKNKKQLSKSFVIILTSISGLAFIVFVAAIFQLIRKKLTQIQGSQLVPMAMHEQYERLLPCVVEWNQWIFRGQSTRTRKLRRVYKCTLPDQDTTAAVKVFNIQQSGSIRSFVVECEALQRVRHRCLIKIVTCCSSIDPQGHEFKTLVFEFMPNGSLKDWLHPESEIHTLSNTLSLAQRLDIVVSIMDALDYLHNQCLPPIVHCDLKPSNVLLAEDMSARVGDFGISKILTGNAGTSELNSVTFTGLIRGSIGYVPPEYGEHCAVSTLGDVYSVGILLLEMFTGRSPTDDMFKDSLDLHKFAVAALPNRAVEIADPAIWLHEEATDADAASSTTARSRIEGCLDSVTGLGVSCSKQQPRERMPLRDAAVEMRAIRDAFLVAASSLN